MKPFKPVIIFIIKFIAVYFLLLIAYNYYLSPYHDVHSQDPYSRQVAEWSVLLNKVFGYSSHAIDDPAQPWTWIYLEGERTSYINEGCNAVSILIIFIAFIIAFSTNWLATTMFILGGIIVIELMNIFRISLLNYIFRYHAAYGKAAHDYLFPLIIYGAVFLLWVLWVRYFVMKKNKSRVQVV